jgi:glycosyltransferase involved in cell wall biosynthesis
MKNVLFIDLTPFYGGGQKFIFSVHQITENDAFFIVSDDKLYNDLKTSRKLFLHHDSGLVRITISINNYIKYNNIDTVVLNGNRPIYLAVFIKARIKIAYKHTSNNAFNLKKRFLGALALNISYLFCEKIVLLYKNAVNEIWLQKKKVEIINNGILIPTKKRSTQVKSNNSITIACISRLDENKGIEWLINVFEKVFKNNPNVVLKIAGGGELHEKFTEMIKENELTNIILSGFVNDITTLLISADIFILPSKFESFPLSILEAMSFSLPIIATDTGGIDEMVINGENGFLIEYKNDNQLQNALVKLVNDPSVREEMGVKSFQLVASNFQLRNSIRKLEKIINE